MKGKSVKKDEAAWDLATIRKAKRRLNQAIKELEKLEKHILKFRRAEPRQSKPSAEQLEAVHQFYVGEPLREPVD